MAAKTVQMTLAERRAMAALSTRETKARALISLWCAKEAYVKALGEGVGFGLDRIEVNLDDEAQVRSIRVDGLDVRNGGWTLGAGYLDGGEYRWVCLVEAEPNATVGPPTQITWNEVVKSVVDAGLERQHQQRTPS